MLNPGSHLYFWFEPIHFLHSPDLTGISTICSQKYQNLSMRIKWESNMWSTSRYLVDPRFSANDIPSLALLFNQVTFLVSLAFVLPWFCSQHVPFSPTSPIRILPILSVPAQLEPFTKLISSWGSLILASTSLAPNVPHLSQYLSCIPCQQSPFEQKLESQLESLYVLNWSWKWSSFYFLFLDLEGGNPRASAGYERMRLPCRWKKMKEGATKAGMRACKAQVLKIADFPHICPCLFSCSFNPLNCPYLFNKPSFILNYLTLDFCPATQFVCFSSCQNI